SHDSLPRETTMSISPRSHRVPFYMDTLNYNSTSRGVLFVKEYVNTGGFSAPPCYGRYEAAPGTVVCLQREEFPLLFLPRSSDPLCSYCSREIQDCPKIIVDHLNICCHEYCFRCGICHRAMGDLLDKTFIHRDIVHCDRCYEKLF
ncbi:ZN185 protein, partial [Baryphthengus martii]|nr:ZN185 protein [Baryphthengus martii]